MPSWVEEEFATILSDLNQREAAVIDLIARKEEQALIFLQFYTTVELATVAAIVACFTHRDAVWIAIGNALMASTVALFIGSAFCIAVLRPTSSYLPGESAPFWQWVLEKDREKIPVLLAYLEQSDAAHNHNRRVNQWSSRVLFGAKAAAAAAPIAGLIVFWLADHMG